MAYIRNLPINDTPEIFGLHDNANITFAQNETNMMLEGLVALQPKLAVGGGKSREEVSGHFALRAPLALGSFSDCWFILLIAVK